jgi:transcriptional regulator with GAF, ATPase, and Fis domain
VKPRPDPLPYLAAVAAAGAAAGQPDATFRALDAALGAVLGHKLFTVLLHHAGTRESERVYTNQPAAYPAGGRKALRDTAWGRQVLQQRRVYLGRTAADIRADFPDHELIASLGCASIINLPVVSHDELLGTINLLHEEGWYDDADVSIGLTFAALAIPAYLLAARSRPS